ncbi:hypothetical protein Tco_0496672 [Tanacetum coccineum]
MYLLEDYGQPTTRLEESFGNMSTDVARGHGGDGGGDDRPPSHHIPTGCGGCLGNRGLPKTQLGVADERAGAYRRRTRNLVIQRPITKKKWPQSPSVLSLATEQTLTLSVSMDSLGNNYLGSCSGVAFAIPSWVKTSLNASLHGIRSWPLFIRHPAHYKITMARSALKEKGIRFLTRTGLTHGAIIYLPFLRTLPRSYCPDKDPVYCALRDMHMEELSTERTVADQTFFLTTYCYGVFLNLRTSLYEEMLRLQGLGSTPRTVSVPYNEDESGHRFALRVSSGGTFCVGRVLPGQGTVIPPPPPCTHSSDVVKLKKREKSQPEIGGGSGSGGREDDEQGDDEDDGEDGEDEDDS